MLARFTAYCQIAGNIENLATDLLKYGKLLANKLWFLFKYVRWHQVKSGKKKENNEKMIVFAK